MLNLFPIQFLALFAYFILRIITGLVFLNLGLKHYKKREELSSVLILPIFPFGKISVIILITFELIIGTLLILGLFTQIAAILIILTSVKMLFLRHRFTHDSLPSKLTYFLLLGIGISLLITGAGVFAFDLPI